MTTSIPPRADSAARILVIDDNPAIHADFRKVLCPSQGPATALRAAAASLFGRAVAPEPAVEPATTFEVDGAGRGQDGLAMLLAARAAGRPYAAAFVDMRMPNGWNGLETTQQLWREQPDLLIVLCTAFSDYSWDEIRAALPRSDRFLILKKPFDNIEVQQLATTLCARQRTEQALAERADSLATALEQLRLLELSVARINDMVMISTGPDPLAPHGIVFVNEAFERQTGYSRAEVAGRGGRFLAGPQTDMAELKRIIQAIERGEAIRTDLVLHARDGHALWVDADVTQVPGQHGLRSHWVGVMRDISAQKAEQARIEHLAYYDALTGLPNRRLLVDRLQQQVAACARNPQYCGLVFIDLDNFKAVNDTLGHDAGDRLLVEVANRLRHCVREEDTVARLGGDEFVVLLKNLGSDADEAARHAGVVARKITLLLATPLPDGSGSKGAGPLTTASLGIGLFGLAPTTADELLKNADVAMYHAKAGGKNRHAFFEPDCQVTPGEAAFLTQQLRHAADRGQLRLKFQPQFDREARLVGAEALLRWECPGRGQVPPAIFLPLALRCGVMAHISSWVLQAACRELGGWADQPGLQDLVLAVNIGAEQFLHADFVEQLQDALRRHAAAPARLSLELSSDLVKHDTCEVAARIREVAELGVGSLLDICNAEQAQSVTLPVLRVGQLKLDRCLVRQLPGNPQAVAQARTIVAHSQALGLPVAATGVETLAQQRLLIDLGCDQLQGYLYSRPVPAAELLASAAQVHTELEGLKV